MDHLISTSGDVSAIVPAKWSQTFYDSLFAKTPFASLIARDYEGEITGLGSTVKIPQIAEIADGTVLPEGTQGNALPITATTTSLVVNKRVTRDFQITSEADLQSIPFMADLETKAIRAILRGVQNEIIAAISPSAAAPDHQIAYASGTTLAKADILAGGELLDTANVPQDNLQMVVGAAQKWDLLNITEQLSRDYKDSNAASTGVVTGQVYGFNPSSTTVVGNTSYFFHPSFMQMAVAQNLVMKLYDLGGTGLRAFRLNVDLFFGLVQMDNKRVVTIS